MKFEQNYAKLEEIEVKENIRKEFDEEGIKRLADSIKLYGIIVPLVIRKTGKKLILIDGERRLRAAKLIGLSEVPFMLATGKIKDDEIKQLIANIHRKELSSLDLAKYYQKLALNMTQQDIAKLVCKTQAHVSQILKLNNLSRYQKEKIKKGEGYSKVLVKHSPNYTGEENIGEIETPQVSGLYETIPDDKPEFANTETKSLEPELLSFRLSGSSPERIAEELKVKLEGQDIAGSVVSIELKLSEFKDEEIVKMLTDEGEYGYIDNGNFVEL